MKLGVCYMVFDGEELLEFAARAARAAVDHLSVTYQTTSYFGNPADTDIEGTVRRLQRDGLIDEVIFYQPDLSLHHKENELRLRNIGLEASRRAGCTHHISADVDEIFESDQLNYAKREMESGDYDVSVCHYDVYYKSPTYLVVPDQGSVVTFIHPVDNEYDKDITFPFPIETTRRLKRHDRCRQFSRDELVIHHMSYVRKNIRKKFANSDNGRFYPITNFMKTFDSYQVGDPLRLVPDFRNRRTVEVENRFGIVF